MTIQETVQKAHSVSRSKGFWDEKRNTGELLMLVTSELGEALEADRKGRWADPVDVTALEESEKRIPSGDAEFKAKFEAHIKDTFQDEIADAVIRLFDLCAGLDIDIESHIALKMRYNATRDRLNGKRY